MHIDIHHLQRASARHFAAAIAITASRTYRLSAGVIASPHLLRLLANWTICPYPQQDNIPIRSKNPSDALSQTHRLELHQDAIAEVSIGCLGIIYTAKTGYESSELSALE